MKIKYVLKLIINIQNEIFVDNNANKVVQKKNLIFCFYF